MLGLDLVVIMNETEQLRETLAALPDETSRAHSAFLVYAGLGRERSIDRAYLELYGGGQKGDRKGARAATFFQEWSARFRWRERVEAYESALEGEYIAVMRDRHYAEISRYATDRLREGKTLTELSEAMAVYGAKQLLRLVEENVPMDSDQTARFLRAMAFVSVAATEARADALSVRHLTRELEAVRKAEARNNE